MLRDDFLSYEWGDFLAACILYDPPAERLTKFAAYGGPTRVSPCHAADDKEPIVSATAPPIEVVRDPFECDIARIAFMFEVIDVIEEEIDKRHPDIGVKSIIRNILDDEDFAKPMHSRLEKIPKRYYLDVREDTPLEDIKRGYPRPTRWRRRGQGGGVHGERPVHRSSDRHQRSETTHTLSQGSVLC
jgi:hypothetical protein